MSRSRRIITAWAVAIAALTPVAARSAPDNFTCAGRLTDAVRVYRTSLAGVPALVRRPAVVSRPPILLWHGYGAPGSEAELMDAMPLDDVPALKVYLGLPLFGARAPAPPAEPVAARQQRDFAGALFQPVVMGAAAELPPVVAALRARGCVRPRERIGVFGFSAGGTAALIALADRRTPIGAAVTINAPVGLTPTIEALARATHQPFAWSPTARLLAARSDVVARAAEIAAATPALLLLHGADDPVVGPQGARDLARALAPLYRRSGHPERLKLSIVPAVPHDWSASPQLAALRTAVGDWFNRFLVPRA